LQALASPDLGRREEVQGVVPDETGCGVVAPVRAALVAAGCSEGPSEVRAAFAIGRASAGMDKSGGNCGGPNEVDFWVERCDADRVQPIRAWLHRPNG